MEHADTAQLAALGGALGAVLALLAGRPGAASRCSPASRSSLPRSWRSPGRSAAARSTG